MLVSLGQIQIFLFLAVKLYLCQQSVLLTPKVVCTGGINGLIKAMYFKIWFWKEKGFISMKISEYVGRDEKSKIPKLYVQYFCEILGNT